MNKIKNKKTKCSEQKLCQ